MFKNLSRKLVVAIAALFSTVLLTGCIKLDMDLTVNSDKTVSGTVIGALSNYLAAMAKESGDASTDSLTSGLDSLFDESTPGVTVKEYKSGGFTGQKYILDHVAISNFGNNDSGDETFTIKLNGNKATVSGVLDLSMDEETTSGLDVFGSDLTKGLFSSAQMRIAIRFPAKIISSSGEISADGKQVVWTPVFGERNELSATVELPNTKKLVTYAGAGLVLVLLLILALFLRKRGKSSSMTSKEFETNSSTLEDKPSDS